MEKRTLKVLLIISVLLFISSIGALNLLPERITYECSYAISTDSQPQELIRKFPGKCSDEKKAQDYRTQYSNTREALEAISIIGLFGIPVSAWWLRKTKNNRRPV